MGTLAFALAVFVAPSAQATSLPTTITSNTTLTAAGSPWTGSSVTINPGVTVTVDPDAVVKLSGSLIVNGTLDVNGTAADPAIFTSSSDSAAGQWNGITLATGSSTVDHAEVRYATYGISVSSTGSPQITDSNVHHSSYQGIRSTAGGSPQIAANAVHDNGMEGVQITGGGAPVISDNSVTDNAGTSTTAGGINQEIGSNKTGAVDIQDNVVEDNGGVAGIRVWTAQSGTVTAAALGGNEVSDNAGRAIQYQVGNGPIPTDIDTIPQPSGNGSDAVYVSGQIQTSTTWSDPGYPLVFIGGFDLTVNAGKTLTLGPGLVLKAETTTSDISVSGTLTADGAAGDPVTITSLKDDSVGGDTNGDGSASAPAAANWGGISLGEVCCGIGLDPSNVDTSGRRFS